MSTRGRPRTDAPTSLPWAARPTSSMQTPRATSSTSNASIEKQSESVKEAPPPGSSTRMSWPLSSQASTGCPVELLVAAPPVEPLELPEPSSTPCPFEADEAVVESVVVVSGSEIAPVDGCSATSVSARSNAPFARTQLVAATTANTHRDDRIDLMVTRQRTTVRIAFSGAWRSAPRCGRRLWTACPSRGRTRSGCSCENARCCGAACRGSRRRTRRAP